MAANITISVTWPATTAGNSGTGTVHVWLLAKLTANGLQFTGQSQTCGISLPDLALNAIGTIAAGGSKVQITIPASVWEAPSMPTYASTGSLTGLGSAEHLHHRSDARAHRPRAPGVSDPATYAWPSSSRGPSRLGTTFPDSRQRQQPGHHREPLSGNGYVLPPTAIGLAGSAPGADQAYIATRTQVSLSGNWTSCTALRVARP